MFSLTPPRLRTRLAFVFLAFAILASATPGTSPSQALTRSGDANAGTSVVWLVLDEAPLYALLRTNGTINSARYPGFAELAKHSTWYRNSLATAQRTTEALPAMLDGKWPTMRNYPVLADHPINLFTLTKDHMDLDVYQTITSLCPKDVCANKVPDKERQAEFQVAEFRNLISRVSTSTTSTVHFSHILLPHRPWRFSTDFRLGKELETDPRPSNTIDRRRDAYQSLLRQFVATDQLLLSFITSLKESANWDRTMLIVTSDHGMTFVPGESFRDTVNPANKPTLEDIYRVPLFIKYPNQQAGAMNNCPVSSIDILPTVLSVARIPTSAQFDGVDLSITCPVRASRRVRWPYTGANLSTDFSAVVKRVKYYNSWVSANGNVDDIHRVGISGRLIGKRVRQISAVVRGATWTNIDKRSFRNIGSSPMSYVPARVSGRFNTTTTLCQRCEGLLVVDGVVVATVPELSGVSPSSNPAYFTTSLLTTTITPESSPPELWIADWTAKEPRFSKVGPSR